MALSDGYDGVKQVQPVFVHPNTGRLTSTPGLQSIYRARMFNVVAARAVANDTGNTPVPPFGDLESKKILGYYLLLDWGGNEPFQDYDDMFHVNLYSVNVMQVHDTWGAMDPNCTPQLEAGEYFLRITHMLTNAWVCEGNIVLTIFNQSGQAVEYSFNIIYDDIE